MVNLTIGERKFEPVSIERLAEALAITTQYCEIWLEDSGGPSLCCLKSGDDAMLMYLRHEGDSGFVAHNAERSESERIDFILTNGQMDSYPRSWTVPYETARWAMERFWFTKKMDDRISWIDPSSA